MMKSRASIFGMFVALSMIYSASPIANAEHEPSNPDLRVLFPLLDDSERNVLQSKGEFSRFVSGEGDFILIPGAELQAEIAADLRSIDYTIGVEVVNIIPGAFGDLSTVDLINMLLELSSLEGLEYFSASKDKMRTLFVQSYAVDSEADRTRIDDPIIDTLPANGRVTIFQEDKVFGKNVSVIDFEADSSTIHMITMNLTTFSYGFVPIILPERLRLHILLQKTDDYIIYYGNFAARALRINLFKDRIHNSFYNRLVALYGWFQSKLYK